MKKFIAVALSLALALGSLAACSKSETTPETSTAPAATTPELSFKQAYYDVLVDENGELKMPYTETVEEDGWVSYKGTLFAELFDWNLDGAPELMVGYIENPRSPYVIDYLDVYTVENGEAKKLLTANVYETYRALDGSQNITFNCGLDGTLYLGIYNEETYEMNSCGETLYSFKDGVVESTTFYFENENPYEGLDSFINFEINGESVTEDEFNAKRREVGADDRLNVFVHYYGYDELVEYLSGETDTYKAEFIEYGIENDELPAWVNEVDFGYDKTYPESVDETEEPEVDFDSLTELVRGIWLSTPAIHISLEENGNEIEEAFVENIVYYDSTTDDALAYAMFMIMNEGVTLANHTLAENIITDISACYDDGRDEEIPADPLGQFEILPGEGYWKINADQVDWVLVNYLNVTPDRTKTDDDFDIEHDGVFDYYYYDGYYYYDLVEGGGGGHTPTLIDYTLNEDGSYTVTYSTTDEAYPYYAYNIIEANAFIHEVDGEEVWCVNYVKVIEHVPGR